MNFVDRPYTIGIPNSKSNGKFVVRLRITISNELIVCDTYAAATQCQFMFP